MSLTFKGTAHPPASRTGRKTAADLSNAMQYNGRSCSDSGSLGVWDGV